MNTIIYPEVEALRHLIAEQKDKIESLTAKVKRYEEVIKCCDDDYWFMINLIDRYSSDKDQTLKDCLERMKFRMPMFRAAISEDKKC